MKLLADSSPNSLISFAKFPSFVKFKLSSSKASSTIEEKNYDIESLCYKALEIIRSLNSEKTNRAALVDELINSGLPSSSSDDDLIQANELLRWLDYNHEIFLVEDSGLVNVTTYRNISNFDRHQRQLQEQWLLLHTKELGPSCAIEEAREIAAAAIVREEEDQKQQQQQQQQKKKKKKKKKKKRRYHSRHVPTKKQTEEEEAINEEGRNVVPSGEQATNQSPPAATAEVEEEVATTTPLQGTNQEEAVMIT